MCLIQHSKGNPPLFSRFGRGEGDFCWGSAEVSEVEEPRRYLLATNIIRTSPIVASTFPGFFDRKYLVVVLRMCVAADPVSAAGRVQGRPIAFSTPYHFLSPFRNSHFFLPCTFVCEKARKYNLSLPYDLKAGTIYYGFLLRQNSHSSPIRGKRVGVCGEEGGI